MYCSCMLLNFQLLMLYLLQLKNLLLLDLCGLQQAGLHLLYASQLVGQAYAETSLADLKWRLVLTEKVVLVCFVRQISLPQARRWFVS